MDCICSASAYRTTIRLVNAPMMLEIIVPERTSFTVVHGPPIVDRPRTRNDDARLPTKAQTTTPYWPRWRPRSAEEPSAMANVAPRDAPDDIPRMYGSARGFWTVACIMTPASASAMPTVPARNTRGDLMFHTMSK